MAISGGYGAQPIASGVGVTYEEVLYLLAFKDMKHNAVILRVDWESIEMYMAFLTRETNKKYLYAQIWQTQRERCMFVILLCVVG